MVAAMQVVYGNRTPVVRQNRWRPTRPKVGTRSTAHPCESRYRIRMQDDDYGSELYRIMPPRKSDLRQAHDAATRNPLERLTQQTLRGIDRVSEAEPPQAEPDRPEVARPKLRTGPVTKWLGVLLTAVLAAVIAGLLLQVL